MWNTAIELHHQLNELEKQNAHIPNIETRLSRYLEKEARKTGKSIESLLFNEPSILEEFTKEDQISHSGVGLVMSVLKGKIVDIIQKCEISDMVGKKSQMTASWDASDYPGQTAPLMYAEWRAKAEAILWSDMGFKGECRHDPLTQTFECWVNLEGPLELLEMVKVLHRTPEDFLGLIYKHLPACNVKVLMHNHKLPNRWDVS
jgi:hypothetical protein